MKPYTDKELEGMTDKQLDIIWKKEQMRINKEHRRLIMSAWIIGGGAILGLILHVLIYHPVIRR